MKRFILFILLVIQVFLGKHGYTQYQPLVDSLKTELKTAAQDTNRASILYQLSKAHWGNNPEKAMTYAKECLSLSEQLNYKKGIGNAYLSIGAICDEKGDYELALESYKKSLILFQEIGYKKGMANSLNNIGLIYYEQGNIPRALDNYFASLKIKEEIGDKMGCSNSYLNIGLIYKTQGDYNEALKHYSKGLKLAQEVANKKGIASAFNNIGLLFFRQGKFQDAMDNFLACRKIEEEIDDKNGLASTYSNIADIYDKQGQYQEALQKYIEALIIVTELEDKGGIAYLNNRIGKIYTSQTKYDSASKFLNNGLLLSKEIGAKDIIAQSYYRLTILDSVQNKFSKALEDYKLYIIYRDSLVNNENTKKITQQQMQYDFDKKEVLTKAEQEKKDALTQKELQGQKLVRNGFIGGFVLVLLFAGVFFRQRNYIKKGKQRSDDLLLNILPAEVAEELKEKGSADARQFDEVTVMFTDFKDFTRISEKLTPSQLVAEIHTCFKVFDQIITKYNIEKIKTIGDSYMCASGLHNSSNSHASDMVSAAFEILTFIAQRNQQKISHNEEPFEIRIGINTGPVVAGIVGVKKFAYDIWGDTVNTSARLETKGEAGKINISGTTYNLIKHKFHCTHRGKIDVKGKGEVDMYFVGGIV